MSEETLHIRVALPSEFAAVGRIMVAVYSALEGFPSPAAQPEYYAMLADIGAQTSKPGAELLVAVSPEGDVAGGVVYFADMAQYGSGGTATQERQASGFRLLAVDPRWQGRGLARRLAQACIDKARAHGNRTVVIHTTQAMQLAWALYERMGFRRATDLDFRQGDLPVFGFRLAL
jgi:GNAT superfamily N-acetyltransferase